MSTLIAAQIDVSKIDKSKLKDGKYYDITISVNDEINDFKGFKTNVTITEAQTKEQRESKVTKNYLGNGKVFWNKGEPVVVPMTKASESIQTNSVGGEDLENLPF